MGAWRGKKETGEKKIKNLLQKKYKAKTKFQMCKSEGFSFSNTQLRVPFTVSHN